MTTSPPEVLAVLRGARVRRVDVPEPDLVAITLLIDRVTATLVLSVSEKGSGLGLLDERPRGEPAASFAQLLRKHLAGAVLEHVVTTALDEVRFAFRRDETCATLQLSVRRRGGGVVLRDHEDRALGGAPRGVASIDGAHGAADPSVWPRDLDELRIAGQALMARRGGDDARDRNAEQRRGLIKARARVARRVQAIESDLVGTAAAAGLRADGALLLSSLASVPARASEVELEDPETGLGRRITLDPARSPVENAERAFVRARKLDRGAEIARQRLDEARRELARFDAAIAALAAGAAVAPVEAPSTRERKEEPRRLPYRTFRLEDGSTILVGRGARDNDALTFRHAAPDDHFFHARGRTGAHVILRVVAGHPPTEAAEIAAGTLAAHFSAARGDTAVDVTRALRRELRRGKAAGSVIMRTSTTLRVRMEHNRIASLLAREVAQPA